MSFPCIPDELVKDSSAVPGFLQQHLALVTQQLSEKLTVHPQQQAVGVEGSDLIGAHSLHSQDGVTGVALLQQVLQSLEQHLGVVDGGACCLPTDIGSLSCSKKRYNITSAATGPAKGPTSDICASMWEKGLKPRERAVCTHKIHEYPRVRPGWAWWPYADIGVKASEAKWALVRKKPWSMSCCP